MQNIVFCIHNWIKVSKNLNIATAAITTAFIIHTVSPVQAASAESTIKAYEILPIQPGNQNFSGVLGMDFVVNCPIMITELGAFDDLSNGIAKQITTELWLRDDKDTPNNFFDDQGIKKLASIVFTNKDSGSLEGGSRFKPLSIPLVLMPGSYTIVSYGYSDLDKNGNIGKNAPQRKINDQDGFISFVGSSRYGGILGNSIGTKVDQGPVDHYAAGTFKYTAVPERLALNQNLNKDSSLDKSKHSQHSCYTTAQNGYAAAGGGGGGSSASRGSGSNDLPLILGGTAAALGLGFSIDDNQSGVSRRSFVNNPIEITTNHGSLNNSTNNSTKEEPKSTPAPEPLNVVGTAVAGVLGIWMKRKQAKTKMRRIS